MKPFNLHITHMRQQYPPVLKQYALVLSTLIFILTGYTCYSMYTDKQPAAPQETLEHQEPAQSVPVQQSALHNFVHILEHMPHGILLTHTTVTQTSLVLKGSLRTKNGLTAFLKKIAPSYTIVQAKTTEDMNFTLELKTS